MPTNRSAIDWITRTLAFLGACCVVTVCILAYMGKQIPPELNTLTGGLVGSLASMLVKTTPTEDKSKIQEVQVVNEKKDPVPTEPQPEPTPP